MKGNKVININRLSIKMLALSCGIWSAAQLGFLPPAVGQQPCPPSNNPSAIGQWEQPVLDWRGDFAGSGHNCAVHLVVVPTGEQEWKVIMIPYGDANNPRLWDPNCTPTPTDHCLTTLPWPGYSIFCGGHSLIPDGRVLFTGGQLPGEINSLTEGEPKASYYNPFNSTWTSLPDMRSQSPNLGGRWYPTSTPLASGEVLVTSGLLESGDCCINALPQVWNPAAGAWRDLIGAQDVLPPPYTRTFLAPNGKVFFAMNPSHYLDTSLNGAWSDPVSTPHLEGHDNPDNPVAAACMDEAGTVYWFGGGLDNGGAVPIAACEKINLAAASPEWTLFAPMPGPRKFHIATILPDGKFLITGGRATGEPTDPNPFDNIAPPDPELGGGKAALLYDPDPMSPTYNTWTQLATECRYRGYHSTAVLLPDGRVLSASGEVSHDANYMPTYDETSATAQIFSPPYLFNGTRPVISSGPSVVGYGETFFVGTPDAASITKVTWTRLSSTTHGFNWDQRINVLTKSQTSCGLNITAPANQTICPPGYYMLWLINGNGVPSKSRLVRISPDTPMHDLNAEFSVGSNPSTDGRWAYGYSTAIGSSFVPVGVQHTSSSDNGTQIPSWQFSAYQTPAFYYNPTSVPITVGGGQSTMPPKGVWFYPGDQGQSQNFGIIRYTVQSGEAGLYQIKALVEAVYLTLGTGDTDFHVLRNGVELFGQAVFAGASAAYVHSVVLNAGDTVDFVVGRGADNNSYASGLKIWANLRRTGLPAAPLASHDVREEFSTAANPATRWAYGYSTAIGSSFVPVGVQHTSSSDNGTQIPSWQFSAYQTPAFYYNPTSVPITVGGGQSTMPPKGVWFYPGDQGQSPNFGIIRYSVPAGEGGLYQVGAIVEAVYLSWNTGDSDFHILKNGLELSNQAIAAGGKAIYDAPPLSLCPGDTVDFVIGRGADGSSYASGLKIWAEVCRIRN